MSHPMLMLMMMMLVTMLVLVRVVWEVLVALVHCAGELRWLSMLAAPKREQLATTNAAKPPCEPRAEHLVLVKQMPSFSAPTSAARACEAVHQRFCRHSVGRDGVRPVPLRFTLWAL